LLKPIEFQVVHVTVAGRNQAGVPLGEVKDLRQEVFETDPYFSELVLALDSLVAHPRLHEQAMDRMYQQGKFLMGIYDNQSNRRDLSGLLYAEAKNQQPDKSFSFVRTGTWLRESRVQPDRLERVQHYLVDMALQDINGGLDFGVPVNRLTRVVPFHTTRTDKAEGYIIGHERELDAIRNLPFPIAVKKAMASAARAVHRSELVVYAGQPVNGDVPDKS
jgi:hypothetical protein